MDSIAATRGGSWVSKRMEPAAITDTKPAARRWLGWLGQCGRYCRI